MNTAADDEPTRYAVSRTRQVIAPEERGRHAESGEQLVGIPELTRALATHYTSLAQIMTLKATQHSLELGSVASELRDTNQRLAVLIEDFRFVVSRSLERRHAEARWWRQPALWALSASWMLAGCIVGTLLALWR